MKKLKLRCICTPNKNDMPGIPVERINEVFHVGGTYFAEPREKLTQRQIDSGRVAVWDLIHFELPFSINKKPDANNRKGHSYYMAPGVPGLVFTDKMHNLEVRDTRRNSDWDKLQDKRVVRRMLRQMAKTFHVGELKLARNHKR